MDNVRLASTIDKTNNVKGHRVAQTDTRRKPKRLTKGKSPRYAARIEAVTKDVKRFGSKTWTKEKMMEDQGVSKLDAECVGLWVRYYFSGKDVIV